MNEYTITMGDSIWARTSYLNHIANERYVKMVEVVDVQTYNDRVVKLTFTDGTFTKAVCGKNDIFDLDTGITICLIKKMLGNNGHKKYNDLLRNIHKLMELNEERKQTAILAEKKRKEKLHKAQMKAIAKKLKHKEELIDIHKQAILRADHELNGVDLL